MTIPKIKVCENNESKRKTSGSLRTDTKIALCTGGFSEAILNEYAFIEDRFKSILFHVGILLPRNSAEISTNVLNGTLREKLEGRKHKQKIKITTISAKIRVTTAFLKTAAKMTSDGLGNVPLIYAVCRNKEILGQESLLQIRKISNWLKIRNEIIHASYDKDLDDLKAKTKEVAEQGQKLCKWLDAFSKRIRRAAKRLKEGKPYTQ